MSCDIKESFLNNFDHAKVKKILSLDDGRLLTDYKIVPIGYLKTKQIINFDENHPNFKLVLKNVQKEVILELKFNSCLFDLPTGFGKTIIGLFLACHFKKVLILTPRKIIYEQWNERVKTSLSKADNIKIVLERSFYNKIIVDEFYDAILVDECHMNEELVFGKILPSIFCRYLFGFSASPNKKSEFYEHYFKQTIKRHEIKNLEVCPFFLNFPPEIFFIYLDGKKTLDYNRMLSSLTNNNVRLKTITDIIRTVYKKYKKKTIVLAKNVNTVKFFDEKLKDKGLFVDTMYGDKKSYDSNAEILIGTYQKMGVGFDSFVFEVLIVLDNVKDIIQAEGRIRNYNFILIDIIDDHFLFHNHWKLRRGWYLKRGGKILEEL